MSDLVQMYSIDQMIYCNIVYKISKGTVQKLWII